MAAEGFATVSITAAGHGFGPNSKVVIGEKSGATTELPAYGRGVDYNGDSTIAADEGCLALKSVLFRDCMRQTAVDLMQLVRAIRAGIDLDGDGTRDLDPDRVSFIGISLGAMYGLLFSAVDPNLSAAVLSGGGGPLLDPYRWSPDFRFELGLILSSRTPALRPNRGNDFDPDFVLRDHPVRSGARAGAIDIQNLMELLDWIQMPGDPLAYAPHLRTSTLPGVPIKRVLFATSRGDMSIPNPLFSAWVRAANMREWSVIYRHDLVRAAVPEVLPNPHRFLTQAFLRPTTREEMAVTIAAQWQAARFLANGERCGIDEPCIPDADELLRPVFGRNVLEVVEVLPEDLGFVAP